MYYRYWVVNNVTRQAKPVSGLKRYAMSEARRLMEQTGQVHFVMRCIAYTEVVVTPNVRRKG